MISQIKEASSSSLVKLMLFDKFLQIKVYGVEKKIPSRLL